MQVSGSIREKYVYLLVAFFWQKSTGRLVVFNGQLFPYFE